MNLKVKNNEIKVWGKELLIEEKPHEYKFKIEGVWCLDPYRRLSEKNTNNHIFDPHSQMIHNTLSDTSSCDIIDIYNVSVREIEISDMLVTDLWGHSMNLVKDQLYIIGGVGRNSFQNILYQINLKTMKPRQEHMDDKYAPEMMAFHKTVVYGDKIIIYGGQNEYQVSNKYNTYNT